MKTSTTTFAKDNLRFLIIIVLSALISNDLCRGADKALSRERLRPQERSEVYVEPVTLTEVQEAAGANLNIGAIVHTAELGRGMQKAADVFGLKLDLFYADDLHRRRAIADSLLAQRETCIMIEHRPGEDWDSFGKTAAQERVQLKHVQTAPAEARKQFDTGFAAIRHVRAALVHQIPKYDQILPVAFPVSPLPDDFFQPSKFPYPSPLVRVPRTSESLSASVHAHVSCNMIAQTGNMLHRTSSKDPNLLLMGMEGGNLSLYALPGAIEAAKISAVMTSWVLSIGGSNGANRQILVENNGLESSLFRPGLHAPEEFELALDEWKRKGIIKDYSHVDPEHVLLQAWDGEDVLLRVGMFLIANEGNLKGPPLIAGRDRFGNKTIDFFSTQAFVQQLAQVTVGKSPVAPSPGRESPGGILTKSGTTVGQTIGTSLSELLKVVKQGSVKVQPYIMRLEGGFLVVTPETPLVAEDLKKTVQRIYLDLRGPLTSDQSIEVELEGGKVLMFRRTVLHFSQLDDAINGLRGMGLLSDWEYEGARGRGLFANVVFQSFMGKHRKFMSSLCTWPTDERPERPLLRFYVDGMQRLNFAFITKEGWRQEFVEVPLRIPPVPRDIDLFSGRSSLREIRN